MPLLKLSLFDYIFLHYLDELYFLELFNDIDIFIFIAVFHLFICYIFIFFSRLSSSLPLLFITHYFFSFLFIVLETIERVLIIHTDMRHIEMDTYRAYRE